MNIFRGWQYLRYLLRANGRHGTHSPFVYQFVDQYLLKQENAAQPANLRTYFCNREIAFISCSDSCLAGNFPPGNLLKILAISDIHSSRQNTKKWQELVVAPAIPLSIELFDLGLLFFQPELKVKQHFVLKCKR